MGTRQFTSVRKTREHNKASITCKKAFGVKKEILLLYVLTRTYVAKRQACAWPRSHFYKQMHSVERGAVVMIVCTIIGYLIWSP